MVPFTALQKRLWKLGGAVAAVLLAILIANPLSPKGESVTGNMLGIDFTAFYTGGTLLREGRWAQLYDLSAIYQNEQKLRFEYGLDMKANVGPWWNPPFYAWVFEPLSKLSFPIARDIWIGINLLCIAGAIGLMITWLSEEVTWKQWGLIPLLVLVSMPVVQCLTHGQNTGTSLLIVCAAVTCWRKSAAKKQVVTWWAFAAGACAGLLVYKPQLALVLGAAVVVTEGRRALLGWLSAVLALLLLSELTTPGMLSVYSQKLPGILHFMQVEKDYLWERHATIKAFWRLLFQGRKAGEAMWIVNALTVLCAGSFALGLAAAIWKRRKQMSQYGDAIIAATIVTTPLLMPFYFDYDLLLVSAAAVLFAADVLKDRGGKVWPWILLYGVLFINPGFGGHTRLNLAVPTLMMVSSMLIRRAWLDKDQEIPMAMVAPQETALLRPAA